MTREFREFGLKISSNVQGIVESLFPATLSSPGPGSKCIPEDAAAPGSEISECPTQGETQVSRGIWPLGHCCKWEEASKPLNASGERKITFLIHFLESDMDFSLRSYPVPCASWALAFL